MKKMILFFARQQKQNKFAFGLSIVIAVLSPLLGEIIAPLYFAKYAKQISNNNVFDTVFDTAIVYIMLLTLQVFIWRIGQYFLIIVQNQTMQKIAQTTANHLLNLSMDFYKDSFVGALVGKHNKFTRAYERIYDEVFFNLLPSLVVFAFTIPVLLYKMPIVGMGMVVVGGLFAMMTISFTKWLQSYNTELAIIDSKVTGIISDQLSNIAAIQSFGKNTEEQIRFAKYNDLRAKKRKSLWLRGYVQWSANDMFKMLMTVSSVLITLYYWKARIFSISEVILVMSYMTALGNRLSNIGNIFKNIKQSQADAEEMIDILGKKPSVIDKKVKSLETGREILFENIRFSYPGSEKPIFDDFSLCIKQGEKVGIVGSSGSGKTTLINLLMRQMDVSSGKVLIGGININEISLRELRHNIALVAQDPALFHRSISDNIKYAKTDSNSDEIISAAQKAQAHDFIMKTQKGYETKVGERGVKLSGGQRQRIALARAFLADCPIMILDEATSSLDSITEVAIQKAINEMLRGTNTMICIAHRLSTVAKMDKIIVMQEGKIVEMGSHRELLEKCGHYTALVNSQELI